MGNTQLAFNNLSVLSINNIMPHIREIIPEEYLRENQSSGSHRYSNRFEQAPYQGHYQSNVESPTSIERQKTEREMIMGNGTLMKYPNRSRHRKSISNFAT
jgi:hypothetical protein